jgi:hypothetical protein
MRHTTERYTDDDIPEIEIVTLKVTQLDEENWRWELIGKRYLSKGRAEPVIRKADETGSKEYAIRDAEEYAAAHRLEIRREIMTAVGAANEPLSDFVG